MSNTTDMATAMGLLSSATVSATGALTDYIALIQQIRDTVAECVMHEMVLHLPDSDPDQAMAAARAAMPRILRDVGWDAIVAAAATYVEIEPSLPKRRLFRSS